MSDDGRQRLDGMKSIAAFIETLIGRPFSRSAASHAARRGRRRRLPVRWTFTGRAYAFIDEIRAFVLRPYRPRRRASGE